MRKSQIVSSLRLVMAGLLAMHTALAVPPPAGVAPVESPLGGFAIDGNLLANSPTVDTGDWLVNTNLALGLGRSVLDAIGAPLDSTRTFHFIDPYNDTSNDRIFTGGDKWLDDPRTWGWTTGKPSAKTDINNTLLHLASDTNGHVWAVLAADRYSTSGDSYIDFELLQNHLTRTATNTFTSGGPNGGRTTNDILLSLAFTGGGKVADFFAWRWMPDGSGGFTYTDITTMLPAGRVYVALNSNTVVAPYPVFGSTSYEPNAFAEAAIDLTALIGNFDQCVSVGFKTIMIKTKASASSSASIEDFIDPIQYNLTIGPAANAGPDQVRCGDGGTTVFPLDGSAANGVQPITTTTWSVVNGSATIDNPNALVTVARVSSASATLRLTVNQANGCTKSDDVVLTTQPAPVIEIAGPVEICPRTTNSYVAPAGMTGHAWSVAGNGFVSGPTNQATVKVVAGSDCGQGYTVSLTVSSGVCTVSSATAVLVTDAAPPVLACPLDRLLDCPADTSTNSTGVATATDGCSRATVTYGDSVTNRCGFTQVIARTWTATDECGNSVSKVQMITVQDITAPVIAALPAPATINCPATPSFAQATATDTCDQTVTLTFKDMTTPGSCPGNYSVTRTWTATDDCGNFSTASQTITVQDVTAPVIAALPAPTTINCPATPSFAQATATDTCDQSVTLTFKDVTTPGSCAGNYSVTRTWTATDDCGNASTASQTINVQDITAPALNLPANLVLEAPGDTRTNVTGVAIAPDACGSATVSYSEVVSNSCGLSKTVWRLWTAVDQCGNTTNGLQTIVVRDTKPPVVQAPAIVVQCLGDVPAPYANLAAFLAAGGKATDNSSNGMTFALASDSGLIGSCPGMVTRVYRVTDACGNVADATQKITVDDTIAPTIACAPSMTLACDTSLDPATTGFATATDNCDPNVNVTYSDVQVPSTYDINWYAADPAPNSAPFLPTYLKLAPGSLPCPTGGRAADPLRNAVAFGPTPGQLDALTSLAGESMSLGQILPFEAVIDVSGGPGPEHGTIEFTTSWSTYTTSNDRFGFDKNYKVYCAFVDSADIGSIDPHANAKVESFSSTIVNAGTIDEKIQGTFRVSGLDTGDRVIVEVWMVLMATQPDHVGGTIASDLVSAQKVLNPPQPISVGSKTISISAHKFDPLPSPQEQPPLSPLPPQPPLPPGFITSVIDRTWAATDDCGNRSTCVQRFTVRDATPPVLTVPASVTLEYPADTRTNVTGVAVAQDSCGSVTLTYSDTLSNRCGLSKVVSRLWTATDEWGNRTNAMQTITVQDITAPVITCPPAITVELGASTSPDVTGTAIATDLSGPTTISYSETSEPDCGNSLTITRDWTATDACGNSASCTQIITVLDTTPPMLSRVANKIIAAGEPLVFDIPTASDAGGTAVVSVLSTTTNALSDGSFTVTCTWCATDACGNHCEPQAQTITIMAPALDRLRIEADGTSGILLRWPTNATDYRLEFAATPNAARWYPVAVTPINTNGEWRVYLPKTEAGQFFRLANTPPDLQSQKLSNGSLLLTWPTLPSGFRLETSATLAAGSWMPVAIVPGVSNALNHVTVVTTAVIQFYRLKQ